MNAEGQSLRHLFLVIIRCLSLMFVGIVFSWLVSILKNGTLFAVLGAGKVPFQQRFAAHILALLSFYDT